MSEYNLLKGIRVIDLSTYVAGPASAKLLADMGAEVIKVEPPMGDQTRFAAAAFETPCEDVESPIYEVYNSGKKNISLNLKSPEGMAALHHLLSTANVFVTYNRQKALVKMGLDYDSLKEKYPHLVYGHLLGFGDFGPLKDAPGLDSTAFMGRSGFLRGVAGEDECLSISPYAFGDTCTGTALFGGICAALVHQAKTGEGKRVAVSLYGAAIWYNACMITGAQEAYGAKFPKKRGECIPTVTTYRCADGEWVMPTVLDYKKFRPMCEQLGIASVSEDPRFASFADMMEHSAALIELFKQAFARNTSEEILRLFDEADIPIAKVMNFSDVSKDEQAWANDYLADVTFLNGHKATLPRTPITITGDMRAPFIRASLIGEDSYDILKGAGYSDKEYEDMKASGVVTVKQI